MQHVAKRLMTWVAVVCLAGCTTVRSIDGTPHGLQERIVAGALLKPGERVVIFTNDGATHRFVVESIREGAIRGNHEVIPIEKVVAVQKRETAVGKTIALIGVVLGIALAVIIGVSNHAGYGLSGA